MAHWQLFAAAWKAALQALPGAFAVWFSVRCLTSTAAPRMVATLPTYCGWLTCRRRAGGQEGK